MEPGPSPEDLYIVAEERQQLRLAISRLSRADQDLLLARYWGEDSQEQVAEQLGCCGRTVRRREQRALARLRELLGE